MQEIFDAIKNVFTNMSAIGWEPWPVVRACAATIIVCIAMEDDVLDVNALESKRKQGRAKMAAFAFGYFVSVVACFEFDKPKDSQEIIQAFMFSLLNSGLGYLAFSFYKAVDPIGRINEKFGHKSTTPSTP